MNNTATFIIKKSLAQVLLTALFLKLWVIYDSNAEIGETFFANLVLAFLGTLGTGYLIFLCV